MHTVTTKIMLNVGNFFFNLNYVGNKKFLNTFVCCDSI